MHNGPRWWACVGGYNILIGCRLMLHTQFFSGKNDSQIIVFSQQLPAHYTITHWSINSAPRQLSARWRGSDTRGCQMILCLTSDVKINNLKKNQKSA